MKRIAYYITPHGFGHAVRSLEVIRHLLSSDPGIRLTVISDIPEFLIKTRVGKPLPYRRRRLDVGMVQIDSVRFDLKASLGALEDLYENHERLVEEEVRFLRDEGIQMLVSDIAFLPFRAASQCGIPGIGLGNFTWDWIYAGFVRTDPRWQPLIAWIKDCYRCCDLLLQLPMHGDCSACPKRRDVPLVARQAERNPVETRRRLGENPHQKHYLLAFSHLELSASALEKLETINDAVFFYKYPLEFRFANGRSLDQFDISYTDVTAAMDGIITKPGYGIVSDCLVHGIPMAYTDRGPFPEYEILVDAIKRHLPNVYLSSQDLYAGSWKGALEALSEQPRRHSQIRNDGAAVCAGLIRQTLEGTSNVRG